MKTTLSAPWHGAHDTHHQAQINSSHKHEGADDVVQELGGQPAPDALGAEPLVPHHAERKRRAAPRRRDRPRALRPGQG